MARVAIVQNKQSTVPDTVESFYASPVQGTGTVISAFTASNDTTSSKTYKAYIYDSFGAVVSAVIPQTIVVRDRADSGPSIVNQTIPPGGTLRMESSSAGGLSFYVTGVEQA